jgi:hypothetical protein
MRVVETAISRYCSGKHGKNNTSDNRPEFVVFAFSAKMNEAQRNSAILIRHLSFCPSAHRCGLRAHKRTQINQHNLLQWQRQHLVQIRRVNANQKRHRRAQIGEQRRRKKRNENVLPLERVAERARVCVCVCVR